MKEKQYTASCCCGEMAITFEGEPLRVFRCHCKYCQRRTGSVFQVSAWFKREQVVCKTDGKVFNESENNAGVDYSFCTRCGSTVHWPLSIFPDVYAVAVGCFADKTFPKPDIDIHEQHRHPWVPLIDGVESYKEWPPFVHDLVASANTAKDEM
ncbi:MAG: GFA family protein [Pseudomonadales bacterium]|nr:GFA family protein [Pseudomonadales bacterium]MCP5171180.1 GFA family protein [Pseudomonadales bacterium]MCP5301582.1 GFA family protein [Pseudomonadales bacterium]